MGVPHRTPGAARPALRARTVCPPRCRGKAPQPGSPAHTPGLSRDRSGGPACGGGPCPVCQGTAPARLLRAQPTEHGVRVEPFCSRTDAMWRVVAGTTQLSRLGPEAQVRHVRRVLSHKYYDYGTQENDIALVELDHPIQCNDYIQLACVADTTVRVSELTSCYVSGWGSTSARNAKASDVLQEAQVHLIDLQLCNSTWWYGGAIHSHNVCAGYPQGGIDTCQGDSGGPLVCKDNNAEYFWLVGVTSWGYGCARPFQPGVYTSTQHFYDWILVQMGLHHEVTSAPTPQHFVTSAPPQTQRPTQGTFKPCPYPENKLVEFFKKLQKLLQSLKKKTA